MSDTTVKRDLRSMQAVLSTAFAAARRGVAAVAPRAPETHAPETQVLVDDFFAKAAALMVHEQEFRSRNREGATVGASLTAYLRAPEHFAAMRDYTQSKRALEDIDPALAASAVAAVANTKRSPVITAPHAQALRV